MNHKAECDSLYTTMNVGSGLDIINGSSSFSERCSTASYGDHHINTRAESPARHFHEELSLALVPSWKLYENPFFVDGKLVPKYTARYFNAPLDHAANSFSSASKGFQDNALVPAAAYKTASFSSAHKPSMAPACTLSKPLSCTVLNPTIWEHHAMHRLSQDQAAAKLSDLVNVQAQGQPMYVMSPHKSLKCPSLHLDCQIPHTSASGEDPRINQSNANMAACSIQVTLANILQRLRIVEDNQGRSNATIAKLRLEMEDGSSRIQELEYSHESALREINSLLQRFGEQMATSRRKEQEKLRSAFAHLREEVEEERNTCRLLKLQNKKLMKELEEANMAAADAGEELDRERQARELMEEVCNELAREIGEDKAEVEQLKQEQVKSREMVEEELKMIRLASLRRGERVKTKISEAQLELDDKHHMDTSLPDLKSRVEEFLSTVSVASCEPYKVLNNVHKERKQKKIIEQAKLLRRALELSMRQVIDDGGVLQAQHSDIDLKEETIMAPITEDQYTQYTPTNVCNCCSDKVCECENQSMGGTGGHVELQLRSGSCMVDYTKEPCEDVRRPPRAVDVEDGLFNHTDAAVIPQARRHSLSQHANDGEFQERGSRRIALDTECNKGPWNEPGVQCSIHTPSIKRALVHQKHLSLHLEASQNCVGEIADVWEDDLTPHARRVICCSADDASQVCINEEAGFGMLQQSRRGRPDFRVHAIKQTSGVHPWKSPCMHEEDMRDGDGVDHHAERLMMHHEYEGAKSLCADGADSVEEHGEFDGFYFEPVMDDDLLEDHCGAHYPQEPIMDGYLGVADCDDEQQGTPTKAYERSFQQSKSPKQLTCKTLPHDGGGRTSAKSGGTPTKCSVREETLPTPPPPHKLVLPTPSAIRVPSVKTYYTSPRSGVRSLSPSKPQVLQCFRPPPTSPEHDSAKLAVSSSGKGAKAVETEQSGSSRVCLLRASSNKRACDKMREEKALFLGEQGQQEEPRGAMEDKKANSLRAELLKARELDLEQYGEHVNYDANAKPAAPPSPNKTSFRFSPRRRSLTSTSQAGR